MSKRNYGYKNIHAKPELHAEMKFLMRTYGFVSFTELITYLIQREKKEIDFRKNCNKNCYDTKNQTT